MRLFSCVQFYKVHKLNAIMIKIEIIIANLYTNLIN